MSLGYPVFQDLQSFNFPPTPLSPPSPPTSPTSFVTQLDEENLPVIGPCQIVSPSSEPVTLSLRADLCQLCKGKKYGFTSYFHNTKIFFEPPHEILPVVEESYVLRDRLKSLLVTYAMREVEDDQAQNIETQILNWGYSVGMLADEVVASACNAGFALGLDRLDNVRKWRDIIVEEARYYASRNAAVKMPSGRLAALMLEYRKVWEAVWIGYLQDRKATLSDLYSSGYPM